MESRLRAANNFPAGSGQIVRSNLFLLGHILFLAWQTLNLKYLKLETLNFFLTSVKLSSHLRIWPDKTYFWLDIVRWPAVICSPETLKPSHSSPWFFLNFVGGGEEKKSRGGNNNTSFDVKNPTFLSFSHTLHLIGIKHSLVCIRTLLCW